MAFRRQQTSLQTVEAYHRALDTMGRLAAEQAAAPPAKRPNPDSAYVRVVPADTAPAVPPKPPSVRSRPRRTRQSPTTTPLTAPGPNTRIVTVGDEAAPSGPGLPPEPAPWPLEAGPHDRAGDGAADLTSPYPPATEPAGRSDSPVGAPEPAGEPTGSMTTPMPEAAGQAMLHFDAVGDYGGPSSWGEVAPSQPDREARSGPRTARARSRRQGPGPAGGHRCSGPQGRDAARG